MNLFHDNGLVLRNQYLHDNPANQIGHGADAEDDEVTGRFALEAHEGKGNQYLLASGIYNDIAGENSSVSLCNIGVSAGVISAVSTYALELFQYLIIVVAEKCIIIAEILDTIRITVHRIIIKFKNCFP